MEKQNSTIVLCATNFELFRRHLGDCQPALNLNKFLSAYLEATMNLGRTIYNALFRRTSTFVVTIVVGGFIFERVFDEGMDNMWENMNRGVSI